MNPFGYNMTYPRLLFAVVSIVTLSVLVIAVGTSTAAFGSYNYNWDGTSDLRTLAGESGADVQIARSTVEYQNVDSDRSTAFVLRPTDPYTESDVQTIAEYIDRGGTVVVAADGGEQTNQLLAELDVDSRFDERQLRDEHHYYQSPALPIASTVADSSQTQDVSEITLNHGTAIVPSDGGTILLNSSEFSYIDVNENAELDDSEPIGQHPVIVREKRGDGSVILVSDASVFINTMLERPDNQQFAENLLADSETVVFDYSQRDDIPTAVALILTASDSPIIQWLTVAVFVVIAGLVWRRHPSSDQVDVESDTETTPNGSSYEAVVEKVAEQYPEWEDERVERVARSITRE